MKGALGGLRVLLRHHRCPSMRWRPFCTKIETALNETGEKSVVEGWVCGMRKQKELVFVDVTNGSSAAKTQLVCSSERKPEALRLGCAIRASGQLHPSPGRSQSAEFRVEQMEIVGKCDPPPADVAFFARKPPLPDIARSRLHLRLKLPHFAAMLRLRSLITRETHKFFEQRSFTCIQPPLLTENDCEGGGEAFRVKPASREVITEMRKKPKQSDESVYFGKEISLSVSSQLHLEAAASALGNVYCMGPAFRAENNQSTRHLSEFWMVEGEMAFVEELETIMALVEDLVKHLTRSVLENGSKDYAIAYQGSNKTEKLEALEKLCTSSFARLSFADAVQLSEEISAPDSLSRKQELTIAAKLGRPVFVIDWPAGSKPFYAKADPKTGLLQATDLLIPGMGELVGGSLREDDADLLERRMAAAGTLSSLQWYLDLRRYGHAPLGGFGLGVERLVQFLLEIGSIKDAIAFPRWPHHCQM